MRWTGPGDIGVRKVEAKNGQGYSMALRGGARSRMAVRDPGLELPGNEGLLHVLDRRPELATYLRIEERELETGGLN